MSVRLRRVETGRLECQRGGGGVDFPMQADLFER